MRERLEKLNREFERLARGNFSEEEQLFQDSVREITCADAVGTFTRLQYHLDCFGDDLGVSFDCKNDFGIFHVDTVEGSVTAGGFKVTLEEDVIDDINAAFNEIRDF